MGSEIETAEIENCVMPTWKGDADPPISLRRAPFLEVQWRVHAPVVAAALLILASLQCYAEGAAPVNYLVDLRDPASSLVKVTLDISQAQPLTEVQLPAWNNLYQIHDFARNVQGVEARCDGQPAEPARVDLNSWRGPDRSCAELEFRYAVYAHEAGPYSSQLDLSHAFLNFATLLFYLPRDRARAVHVKVLLPRGWKLATLLPEHGNEFEAANYDALVDSPLEAGHFAEYAYEEDFRPADAAAGTPTKHASYRVIVHAAPSDYSAERLLGSIQKITATETALMQDLPFEHYTFILHFPREAGASGGMEHRDGTAIALPASGVRSQQGELESIIAHEFFHAWNVKRIRPQALEPVDYIHGNDTRDLWLAEGVTSTYAGLALLRAGLIDRNRFYARLAGAIQTLGERPAWRFQSVETSGREAWFEKYSDYNRPERSISYYNKGELVGYLLDLGMRNASRNQAGLDDVMRRLNRQFAQKERYYTLGEVRDIIASLAPTFQVDRFLRDCVQGTQELDYATYLGYAGLSLETTATETAAQGFTVSVNAAGLVETESVDSGGAAERAGLQPGDVLTAVNGKALPSGGAAALPAWRPGEAVELQVAREGETRVYKLVIGTNRQVSYRIEENAHPSPEQLRVREGWLKGQTSSATISSNP